MLRWFLILVWRFLVCPVPEIHTGTTCYEVNHKYLPAYYHPLDQDNI